MSVDEIKQLDAIALMALSKIMDVRGSSDVRYNGEVAYVWAREAIKARREVIKQLSEDIT